MTDHQNKLDPAFASDWLQFQALYKQSAKAVGLTDNFITILYAIYQKPTNCTQRYLVESTHLPKQTIHFVIDKMQKDNLVTTAPSPNDGRVKVIEPTKKGQRYIQEKIVPFVSASAQAFNKIPAEDQVRFQHLLHTYVTNLKVQLKAKVLKDFD